MSRSNWDFDALGSLTNRLSGLMQDPPGGSAPSADRRGPPVSPDRVAIDPARPEPRVQVDPRVAQILANTTAVAETGDGPRTPTPAKNGSAAPVPEKGKPSRPWQRIVKAAGAAMLGVALLGATVGPVLNAPDGFNRSVISVTQTVQQEMGGAKISEMERETLAGLWMEGFYRFQVDQGMVAPPGVDELRAKYSTYGDFNAEFRPMLEQIRETGVNPQIWDWNGQSNDAFRVSYQGADGVTRTMEVPGERMADGKYPADLLLEAMMQGQAAAKARAAGQHSDAGLQGGHLERASHSDLSQLDTSTKTGFAAMYEVMELKGGMDTTLRNGAQVQVTPQDGELLVKMTQANGKTSEHRINERNWSQYEDQVADYLSQRHARPGAPGMGM